MPRRPCRLRFPLAPLAAAAVLGACGTAGSAATRPPPSTTTPAPTSPTTAAPTTAAPTTTTTTLPLPPAGAGALPPTSVEPSANTATFRAEMTVLWRAVQTGDPQIGYRAFFPEGAYLQVKALSNDATDYRDRLLAHFALDVSAAHRLLGSDPTSAQLVGTLVPAAQAAWIPPGACYNRLGYWHLPGARMVYRQAGEERSFGIASLISWRGDWYVVHFGAVLPPAGQGVVDDPSTGTGTYGPPGGC